MLSPAAIRTVIVGIAILGLVLPCAATAAEPATDPQVEALDGAIDKVLQKRVYQWRLPRTEVEKIAEDRPGPLASFFNWLGEIVSEAFSYIAELFGKLIKWLRALGPDPGLDQGNWPTSGLAPESLMLIVLLMLVAVVIFFWVRLFLGKRKKSPPRAKAAVADASPDLHDEKVSADELPADRWLGLAREMIDKGDMRLAMRALYLATLARLADFELLTIAIYKSNLDYKRELDRRAHDKADLRSAFDRSIQVFERSWYGLKGIKRCELDDYAALQEKIIRHVQI